MALRQPTGNYPLLDVHNCVHAVLIDVALVTRTTRDRQREWQEWVWTFESPGVLRPFVVPERTGVTMHPPNAQGEMNSLTAMVVGLGLVPVTALYKNTPSNHALQNAIGRGVTFKMYCKDDTYRINLATLTLDAAHQVPALHHGE